MTTSQEPPKIHVVFKTHLDIGFTGLARQVVENYHHKFIPSALALAKTTREAGDARFVWTTGSWLIHGYLEKAGQSERKKMEEAILAGDIGWHALPFTTHTELIDADLFRHGLSLSQTLDARFGRKTIAAKMTDVPGHTLSIIPLLAEAGVKFLHIGVNGASACPEVPPIFIWRHPEGSEIIVMYEPAYGGTRWVPGASDAISFAHTNDNHGPQGAEEVAKHFEKLRQTYPNAEPLGSTMDGFANGLLRDQPNLPVLTSEIGDTWIHGVGTDPLKVARYRALSRWRRQLLADNPSLASSLSFREFSTELLLVAEHTWGRDMKRWRDTGGDNWAAYIDPSYERSAFLEKRAHGTFREAELSWREQRAYLDNAIGALRGTAWESKAQAELRKVEPVAQDRTGFQTADPGSHFTTEWFTLGFSPESGGMTLLRENSSGREWAAAESPLATLEYQVFGSEDYDRFYQQYNPDIPANEKWSRADFTKPGMDNTLKTGLRWTAHLESLSIRLSDGLSEFLLDLTFPDEAVHRFGAPARSSLLITLPSERPEVTMELFWQGKAPCRIAEALWLGFRPAGVVDEGLRLIKMDSEINPQDVVSRGARGLHACEELHYKDQAGGFALRLLDSPLVAPGRPSLLDFNDRQPAPAADGFHLGLYNNVWGTNFPMWYEEDAKFRFTMNFGGKSKSSDS